MIIAPANLIHSGFHSLLLMPVCRRWSFSAWLEIDFKILIPSDFKLILKCNVMHQDKTPDRLIPKCEREAGS